MIFKVYEESNKVVFEDSGLRKKVYDVGDLSVIVVADSTQFLKITRLSDSEVLFHKIRHSKITRKDGTSIGTAEGVKSYLEEVFNGRGSRSFKLVNYSTNTNFNGDVSYMRFPVAPYGRIDNNLVSESVCIGNADDTVRGTNHTLELRNLSTGAEVYYRVVLVVSADQDATVSLDGPDDQFASASSVTVNGNNRSIAFSGTSSVTNESDWTMFFSMDCDGSGSYRIKSIEISITK